MQEQINKICNIIKANNFYLIGVCGIPGAGKSFVSKLIHEKLQNSAIIPMDGYHLYRKDLTPEGHRFRGAAFTFDLQTFQKDILRLRDASISQEISFNFPSFDHCTKDPKENDIKITKSIKHIIVEGLYIFDSKLQLQKCWDLKIHVKVDLEDAMQMVAKRHFQCKIQDSYQLGLKRANQNDRKNANYVLDNSNFHSVLEIIHTYSDVKVIKELKEVKEIEQIREVTEIQNSFIYEDPTGLLKSLFRKNQEVITFIGSAFLIAKNVLLTTAHNIYSHDLQEKFPFQIMFHQNNKKETDFYKGVKYFCPDEYQNNLNKQQLISRKNDYAIVILEPFNKQEQTKKKQFMKLNWNLLQKNTNIWVYQFPFHKLNSSTNTLNCYTNTLNCYPKKQENTREEHKKDVELKGKITGLNQYFLAYDLEMDSGYSGSPIFAQNNNNEVYIIGMHKGQFISEETQKSEYRYGLHFNHMRDQIKKWIKEYFHEENSWT